MTANRARNDAEEQERALGKARSVGLFRERVLSLADELSLEGADLLHDPPTLNELRRAAPWVVTGAGGSEGPARLLAELMVAVLGLPAVFRPPGAFLAADPAPRSLCVISQHLSPHASMALEHSRRAPLRVLISAEERAPSGVRLLRHGPRAREDLLLPRVLGPELATLAVLRWIAHLQPSSPWARELPAVAEAVRRAIERARGAASADLREEGLDVGTLVVVANGELGSAAASGMVGRMAEALLRADAAVFDLCAFAHGPYQSVYEHAMCMIALEGPETANATLALEQLLRPDRHRLLRLQARLPAPLCWLEHGAGLLALSLAELERRPRDLIEWPGKGADAPLYELDTPPA